MTTDEWVEKMSECISRRAAHSINRMMMELYLTGKVYPADWAKELDKELELSELKETPSNA